MMRRYRGRPLFDRRPLAWRRDDKDAGSGGDGSGGGGGGDGGPAAELLSQDRTTSPPAAGGDGDRGSGDPEWLSGLSEELRGEATFGRYATIDDMARAHLELRSKLSNGGGDVLTPPAEGEDITAWDGWTALGAPDSVEDVTIERPEMPDGLPYNEEREKAFLARAVEQRYPPHVIQDVVNLAAEEARAEHEAIVAHRAEQRRQLDRAIDGEWGSGETRDENLDLARRASKFFGLTTSDNTTIEEQLQGGGFALVKKMAAIGKVLSEHRLDGEGGTDVSKDAAQARLDFFKKKIADAPANTDPLTAAEKAERTQMQRIVHGV